MFIIGIIEWPLLHTHYDDIVGINQKESYISAAEQFVKCCHPPIRLL